MIEIEKGRCICIYEPRGENDMEDFWESETYSFRRVENKHGDSWYRVYPFGLGDEYHSCEEHVFALYFKKV